MRSRRWGLIAIVAMIMAGVLLGITLVWKPGSDVGVSETLTATEDVGSTSSPAPTAIPTPTRPMTYAVQAGDTLSAIAQEHDISLEALTAVNDLANPDMLHIGQILIIPHDEAVEPVLASPEASLPNASPDAESGVIAPTITPSGPSLVEIIEVTGVGELEAEKIALSNQGGMVSLETWTLSSPSEARFVFPALTLFPGGEVRVRSTDGSDTPRDLYWGRMEPAWRHGELVTLRDADGNVVDTYIVPE